MHRDLDLQSKLEAYDANISAECNAAGNHGESGWMRYAAAMASGLAMTTATEAAVFYSGIQNVTASVAGSGTDTVPIQIDGNEFQLVAKWRDDGFTHAGVASMNAAAAGAALLLNSTSQLKRLASGVNISAGAGVFGSGMRALRVKSTAFDAGAVEKGTWNPDQTGFAGIRFNNGSDTHYGWIRLKWTADEPGYPNSLQAIDWAYNTVASQSILAGQTVPEPKVAAVVAAALAAGWAGVRAWRTAHRGQGTSPSE